MSYALALTIIFTTPFVLAFALFIFVYVKELAREKQIISENKDMIGKSMKDLQTYYAILDPLPSKPTKTSPTDETKDNKKKVIN